MQGADVKRLPAAACPSGTDSDVTTPWLCQDACRCQEGWGAHVGDEHGAVGAHAHVAELDVDVLPDGLRDGFQEAGRRRRAARVALQVVQGRAVGFCAHVTLGFVLITLEIGDELA